MGKQWQDMYGDISYSEQWPQWKGQGKQNAPWRGKGKDNTNSSSRKQDKAGPSFPKYDGTEPKQILLVAEQKEEPDSIVKSMQKAVTTARKAEARTRKLQEELAHKERCWASYQQDLRNTYKTEQQRFLQDSARLKEELAEAMVQEKQAKAQLSVSGDDPFDAMLQGQIRSKAMTPERPANPRRRLLDLESASEEELRQALLVKMGKAGAASEPALATASIAARRTSGSTTRQAGWQAATYFTTSCSRRVSRGEAGAETQTGGGTAANLFGSACRGKRRTGQGAEEYYSAGPSARSAFYFPLQYLRRRRGVSGLAGFRTKGLDQEPLKRPSYSGLMRAVSPGPLTSWQIQCGEAWQQVAKLRPIWQCSMIQRKQRGGWLQERGKAHTAAGHAPTELRDWLHCSIQGANMDFGQWIVYGLRQWKQRGGRAQERIGAHTVPGHAPTELQAALVSCDQTPSLKHRTPIMHHAWSVGVFFQDDAALTWTPTVRVGHWRGPNFSGFSFTTCGASMVSANPSFVHSSGFHAAGGASCIDNISWAQHCIISEQCKHDASNLASPGQSHFGGFPWFMHHCYNRDDCGEVFFGPIFEPDAKYVAVLICDALPRRLAGVSRDVVPPLQRQNLLPDAYGFANSNLQFSRPSCRGVWGYPD